MYLNSEVAEMEIMPGYSPPKYAVIGQPFEIQPKIRVSDYYNRYLAKKYVVAVSWPEPHAPSSESSSEAQKAFLDAIKFAYLKGDVSEPSDANGIAEFKSLTVIYFTCAF